MYNLLAKIMIVLGTSSVAWIETTLCCIIPFIPLTSIEAYGIEFIVNPESLEYHQNNHPSLRILSNRYFTQLIRI